MNRETFEHAVLTLLDRGATPRTLNLRAVAREVGCAHTNLYNYVSSYPELLWWTVRAALGRLMELTEGAGTPDGTDLIDGYVRFAVAHPAWYRLIWIDALEGDPPPEVAAYLAVPQQAFLAWMARRTGGTAGDEGFLRDVSLVHGYLHGELAAFVAGRLAVRPDEEVARIRAGVARLFPLLFDTEYAPAGTEPTATTSTATPSTGTTGENS